MTVAIPNQQGQVRDHLNQALVSVKQGALVAREQVATSPEIPAKIAKVAATSFAACGIATAVLGQGLVTKITGITGLVSSALFIGVKYFQQSHKIKEQENTIAQLQTANANLQAQINGPLVQEPGEDPVRAGAPSAAASSENEVNMDDDAQSNRSTVINERQDGSPTTQTNRNASKAMRNSAPKPPAKRLFFVSGKI